RLKILDRTWGSDPEVVARHGDRLARVRARYCLLRARWLLWQGRPREARDELRHVPGQLAYRALAVLPGPLARGLLEGQRSLRHSGAVLLRALRAPFARRPAPTPAEAVVK